MGARHRLFLCALPALLAAVVLAGTTTAQELGDTVTLTGGTFLMGIHGNTGDAPAHEVELFPFTMDAHEVTALDFARFLSEIEYPAVGVTWYGAAAYAEWAGKKLPTEAQWEYAARGGMEGAAYPWGDEFDPLRSNLAGSFTGPTPVMSYIPNGYGLFDMAGNVMEWTRDRYGEEYYIRSPEKNPRGPIRGEERTVRGGAWDSIDPTTIAERIPLLPETALEDLGFRCVVEE